MVYAVYLPAPEGRLMTVEEHSACTFSAIAVAVGFAGYHGDGDPGVEVDRPGLDQTDPQSRAAADAIKGERH